MSTSTAANPGSTPSASTMSQATSNTLRGIAVGGLIGGLVVWILTKKVFGNTDIGVVVAAVGAGALIGGAVTAPKPVG